jgi:ketosteroid isomerase-like protein
MSSENVQFVQRMLVAYLSGDEETMRASITPEGEVHGAPGIVNSGTYHGYEGFRQWISQWEEAWGEVDYELGEPIELGETFVILPVRVTGRGAGSGLEVDSEFGWLYEVRDGKMARFHVYATLDGGLEAARRLSEAE